MLVLNESGKSNLIEFIVEHTKGATKESAASYVQSLEIDWDTEIFEVGALESKDGRPHIFDFWAEDFNKVGNFQ
jgi:hypothetical protein